MNVQKFILETAGCGACVSDTDGMVMAFCLKNGLDKKTEDTILKAVLDIQEVLIRFEDEENKQEEEGYGF